MPKFAVKINAKHQVTIPARVLEVLGVKPGDVLKLEEGPEGFVLRARHIDRARLAPLRGKLRRGKGGFALEAFRRKVGSPKPDWRIRYAVPPATRRSSIRIRPIEALQRTAMTCAAGN